MSEYNYVEKPLLNQLESMEWEVIEQGSGVPQDPTLSLRSSFREVLIKSEFKNAVKAINANEEGYDWLTDAQLEQLFEDFSSFDTGNLLEANETFLQRLYKWQVDVNEQT
ncbi:type I restriction endonuclease, partial [Vibrio splendidus]